MISKVHSNILLPLNINNLKNLYSFTWLKTLCSLQNLHRNLLTADKKYRNKKASYNDQLQRNRKARLQVRIFTSQKVIQTVSIWYDITSCEATPVCETRWI